jgi:hypothetical protein
MNSFYEWLDQDLLLRIKVQPRASSDALAEIIGDALKVRITAAPVDGKANKHLIAFLAKAFKVAKSDIELLSGQTGRDKRLKIHAPKQIPNCIRTKPIITPNR